MVGYTAMYHWNSSMVFKYFFLLVYSLKNFEKLYRPSQVFRLSSKNFHHKFKIIAKDIISNIVKVWIFLFKIILSLFKYIRWKLHSDLSFFFFFKGISSFNNWKFYSLPSSWLVLPFHLLYGILNHVFMLEVFSWLVIPQFCL